MLLRGGHPDAQAQRLDMQWLVSEFVSIGMSSRIDKMTLGVTSNGTKPTTEEDSRENRSRPYRAIA